MSGSRLTLAHQIGDALRALLGSSRRWPKASMPSAMASRTVSRGSSAEPGSCMTIWILAPVGPEGLASKSRQIDAAGTRCCRRWRRPAAGWCARPWSCRSPIRRPGPGVSPGKTVRSTPSTARTRASDAAAARPCGSGTRCAGRGSRAARRRSSTVMRCTSPLDESGSRQPVRRTIRACAPAPRPGSGSNANGQRGAKRQRAAANARDAEPHL